MTNLDKVTRDLSFISLLTKKAKEMGVRVIIHGGYSVDGALEKITKPHKDIDIQIYGNNDNAKEVLQNLFDSEGIKWRDKGRSTFYHNFLAVKGDFCADFYYIKVEGNPFDKEKIIIKSDGSKNETQEYRTHKVKLNGVSFEATLPEDELNDKKAKRHREDIDQDIANLKKFLNK